MTVADNYKNVSLFGLAPQGVCLAERVTTLAGEAFNSPFHHRPALLLRAVCSLLHYSVGSPRLVVNQPAVLWCSDFPLAACAASDHLVCSETQAHCITPRPSFLLTAGDKLPSWISRAVWQIVSAHRYGSARKLALIAQIVRGLIDHYLDFQSLRQKLLQ
jgi:hypothetical protein